MKTRLICALFAAVLATNTFAQSTISFNSLTAQFSENAGTVQLTVYRYGSLSGTATVDYEMYDDTAFAGVDYVASSGTVTFNNLENQKNIALTILDDNVSDAVNPRTVQVTLSNFGNATGGNLLTQHVQISDNEPPPPPLALSYDSTLTFTEGDSDRTAYLTMSLNRPHTNLVWFTFRTTSTPASYNGVRVLVGEARFEPGETTQQVEVEIIGNDTYESVAKTFHFMPILATGEPVAAATFNITITEDDPQATVSIADFSLEEGSWGVSGVEVTLTTDHPVTGYVHWSMSDGTATDADVDYGPFGPYEPVYFANTTSAVLTIVGAYGDLKIEPNETFTITLTSATDMNIGDGTATITIENDDEEEPSFQEESVRLEAGKSTSLTISFPAPAPKGSVLLTSSDPAVKVPASVLVPEQALSVTFDVDATDAVGPTTVTAHLPGALGDTQINATVDAFRDSDLRFQGPRRMAFAGDTSLASITLDPPRAEAVTVTLTASAGIVVPDSVIVPAGGTAEFPFTSLAAGPGWITATYGENSNSLLIEIAAQELDSFLPEFAPTMGGTMVTLKGVGFSEGCTASFGAVAAQTTFVDGQTLLVKTPAHAAASVPVTVTCGVTPATASTDFRFANARRRATRH